MAQKVFQHNTEKLLLAVEPFGVYLTLLACFFPSFRPDTVCRVSIDVPSFEIVCSDQGRVQVVGFF